MLSAMPKEDLPESVDRESPMARYALHARSEILFLLRTIQQRKVLVNLDLPASRQIVVTSIIDMNVAKNMLILDVARGDALNRELLSGKGAEFISQLDGVAISFQTGPVALCTHDNLPALCITIPKTLIRLQRREHFRVALPIARPVRCIVPAQSADDAEPITTHVIDIGCGGVALADISGRLGTQAGRVLTHCRLLLPDLDPVEVTLEIRNSAQIRLANGAFQTRLGCRFVDLPKDGDAKLQRFVTNIERARRNSL
ncbi:MAG: flagellar brake protein [Thiobacillus sp. 65-69]|nr:flagellar brake protein [Thiobacillus sp.]ODU89153.1 MAG: flagellar brake protein [Thiobacillus sp. SCN 65-179]OJW34465.1 MAG: flagellar brake protein [Thiobacillus sp. 65-69]